MSDHRFMYLDLDIEQCHGGVNHALGPPCLHDFTPKDPKALRIYLRQKAQYLDDHNSFSRLKNLRESEIYDPILLETLDRLLTQSSLVAGEKCRRKRRHWFSVPLHVDCRTSPLCPRCRSEEETVRHVIYCSTPEVAKLRALLFTNLKAKCMSIRTKPSLSKLLVEATEAWFQNEIIDWEGYPSEMQGLIKNQKLVGWGQLF